MTAAEFRAFVEQARAEAHRRLADLDAIDLDALGDAERGELAEARRGYVELLESMADDAIQAELDATIHAGRDLTPEEVRAIRTRQ